MSETIVNTETKVQKKRGPKPRAKSEEELIEKKQKQREYFKDYYTNNKEKYTLESTYAGAKIYKLVSPDTDRVFISSTILPLEKRMCKHTYNLKIGQNDIYKKMAELSPTWTIEKLVDASVPDKTHLEKLESIWISSMADKCLNTKNIYSKETINKLMNGLFDEKCLPTCFKGLGKKL